MDGGCRCGIELREKRVRFRWAVAVHPLGTGSGACTCRGRDFEIRECRAEVQTGASRDHRSPVHVDETVDGLVREPRVLADGHRLTELADRDQVRRFDGLVGEDG